MGWEGIGTLIGKLTTYIPGKIEGLKNEKEKLLNERSKILDNPPTVAATKRIDAIDTRLSKINALLNNAAKD